VMSTITDVDGTSQVCESLKGVVVVTLGQPLGRANAQAVKGGRFDRWIWRYQQPSGMSKGWSQGSDFWALTRRMQEGEEATRRVLGVAESTLSTVLALRKLGSVQNQNCTPRMRLAGRRDLGLFGLLDDPGPPPGRRLWCLGCFSAPSQGRQDPHSLCPSSST
jgi:hypothetical protein